ncbi:MAG: MotA/TolQ/ExbB proton channel family protein [Nitrospirae bacterium]|nr:MotA/TolQ/ExbB proton channel family protein [Nitrospirota bacterium]
MDILGSFVRPETFNIWTLRISVSLTTFLFFRGVYLSILAVLFTKKKSKQQLEQIKKTAMLTDDILVERVSKTLYSTVLQHRSSEVESNPKSGSGVADIFLHDATRQAAEHIYESRYLDKISMCANLMPPIGLWGTVSGMIIIFLYTGNTANAINQGALGTKLWSTFFALIYYVTLEALNMFLINRARRRINEGLDITLKIG